MTSLILFEPENLSTFGPMTLLRSAAELRYGIYSNLERTQRIYPDDNIDLWVRPVLAKEHSEKYSQLRINQTAAENTVFFNAATPAWMYPAALELLKDDGSSAVVAGDHLIAARPGAALPFTRDFHDALRALPQIECNAEICEKHPSWIWDYLGATAQAMEFDTKLWTIENQYLTKLPQTLSTLTERNIFIHNTAQIGRYVHLDASNGPIVIDADCKISPFSSIAGPVYLGKRSSLKPSTSIKHTVVGRICNLGGEISGCIVHPYSNKGHEGFLGDSILGSWVNLGAGTTTSNLKNNYGMIKVSWDGNNYDTGRQFLGSIIGDHTKTAIGVRLNTGTLIGPFCNVFQADFPPHAIPTLSWGNGVHELEKAILTAELMMKRRSLSLTTTQKDLIQKLSVDTTPFLKY